MKNTIKRLLSVFLVTVMLIGIAPLTGLSVLKVSAMYKPLYDYSVGDIVEYGSYPQSKVTDSATLTQLNAAPQTWHSYNYMSGAGTSRYDGSAQASDYMQYCDLTVGKDKYRGVKFSTYRPWYTNYQSTTSTDYTYQDNNGYKINTTYWFKYEPLKWRVLDPSEGLVLCENIIDSQAYSNTISYYNNAYYNSTGAYASDYESSSIREWLNDEFYNTAFNSSQQSKIVKTHLENKSPNNSTYNSADTEDKVFLLSYYDVINTNYGFASSASTNDVNRRAHSTDYAKCQGVYTYTGSSYQTADGEDTSYWWLRSPNYSGIACGVNYYGHAHNYYNIVDYTYYGVRPALILAQSTNLQSYNAGDDFNYSQSHTVESFQSANAKYASAYFAGAGVPLDGTNGSPDFCIPGLSAANSFVPQGCGYDPDTGTVLTTSYKYNNDGNSMLFALDGATGEMIGEYFLNDQYGDVVKSHVGGVAVYNNTIYIANDTGILTYDTARLADSGGMRATGFYNISDKLNGAKCSYVTVSDGILWTGNFYDAEDERYNQKADAEQISIMLRMENSVVLGFDLNKSNPFNSPAYKFNIDNEIPHIQSAVYDKDTLYLTTSFGRNNDSVLYFAQTQKNQSVNLVADKFNSVRCLPMMENGFIKDGYLYSMFESAAWKYHGAEDTVSRDPTDVIWKIDLNLMNNNACILGRDTPSFNNDDSAFAGINNFQTSDYYYKMLKKNATLFELHRLKTEKNREWMGSCYGISSTVALSKKGLIGFDDLTSKQNVTKFYDLPKPCEDAQLMNVINYYYLMQYITKGGKEAIISKNYGWSNGLISLFADSGHNKATLKEIVKRANDGNLYVLSFIHKGFGHTYAMVDCCKVNGKYNVKLLDVNSVRKYIYMYIESDFSSFKLEGGDFENGDLIELADVNLMLDLNGELISGYTTVRAKSRAAAESHTKFSIVPDHAFTLTNAEGQTLSFDGENFSGDMTVYDLNVIVKDVDPEYVFEIDNSAKFTLDCNGSVDCSLGNDDTYFSVDGENISGVTFSADTMKLDGKNITFKAFVSTDEEVAENELGLVSISASSAAGVTLNKNNDRVEVTSDGDMSSIEAASYVGTEKETQTYDGKTDKITLTADDVIVAEKKVHSVSVDDVTLNYKKSVNLKPAITADEGVKYTVSYKSSNPKAASVDKDGNVKALKRGNATITVTVTDQYGNEVKDTCNVTVKYSILQWIIVIVLFGWLWY